MVRVGNQGSDGGYLICKNFVGGEGIINIGVNGEDSFGCHLSTLHAMPNHMYDCTNPSMSPCSTNQGRNRFNYVCVGATSEKTSQKEFHSLLDMIKLKGLLKKHIFLKIDCEGGEYPGFKYFPVEQLEFIDQITGELHFDVIYPEEWGMLDIFRTLREHFVPVDFHMNNYGCMPNRRLPSRAIEFTFVNKKLIKLRSQSRTFAQHPLARPNNPRAGDCQIPPS